MAGSGVAEDLEDLYENAPCGYISLGVDGRIVRSNLTFSDWTGFTREELLGKRLRDLLDVAGSIFYETHFAPLIRMQGFFNEVALDLVRKDGAKLAVLANAIQRHDAKGDLLFTRLTIFQATQRRRYERDLVQARTVAEEGLLAEREASELREQFIAVLGHDLRNPLASINAGVSIMLRKGQEAATPELLDLMQRSIRRMQVLIDNVLDLTRTRLGGGLMLQIERSVALGPVFAQVVDELRMAHPDREIVTSIETGIMLDCDPGRLGQLLSNLLGNALTHGSADAAVRIQGDIEGGKFRLSVANEGDPIPPATMERLFQPFYRGEAGASRVGLGLGLYIASEIAKAHGGTIEAISDTSKTMFRFVMPTSGPMPGHAH
jgi:sigma-B regulation protein RsbU (phosphoserine phosphatase)